MLDADLTRLVRYEPDGAATVVGAWDKAGAAVPGPVGRRVELGGPDVHTAVFRTGRAARIDRSDYDEAIEPAATPRSIVGAPISVAGRPWGVLLVASRHAPLPADTETRLAAFTELIATAIANDEARTELAASRARILATADDVRRRIERDLHDGAQQHLVSLALQLRAAQAAAPPEAGEWAAQLAGVADELTGVLEELREIARGIHPAVLTRGGLPPALKALARRSAVPVHLDVPVQQRLPESIEIAAYYAVSEALTNAAKHAHASQVRVRATVLGGTLHVTVGDDGVGGADVTRGSGLVGLADRVEALGGTIAVTSPPGGGTSICIQLPTERTDRTADAVQPVPSPATVASPR